MKIYILQIIEYLFTDLQVSERYGHALEVYKSFNKRAKALTQWLKQVRLISLISNNKLLFSLKI